MPAIVSILVVSTRKEQRDKLTCVLKTDTTSVRAAGSARQAAELFSSEKPDIILSNIELPDLESSDCICGEIAEDGQLKLQTQTASSVITPCVELMIALLADSLEDIDYVRIGLQELLWNAYEHGNCGLSHDEKTSLCEEGKLELELESRSAQARAEGKTISVAIALSANSFSCTITDCGAGFDWKAMSDAPTEPEDLTKLHGRGLPLIQRVFDECTYNEIGNEVTVSKSLKLKS